MHCGSSQPTDIDWPESMLFLLQAADQESGMILWKRSDTSLGSKAPHELKNYKRYYRVLDAIHRTGVYELHT